VTVLDESVLHRLIGSPQVMADQLSYIAERATLPHILVQVVPAGNGANAGLSGGFALASCDGVPDTLRMEAEEDVTAEGRSLVRRAANILVRVQADALPRAASGLSSWRRQSNRRQRRPALAQVQLQRERWR